MNRIYYLDRLYSAMNIEDLRAIERFAAQLEETQPGEYSKLNDAYRALGAPTMGNVYDKLPAIVAARQTPGLYEQAYAKLYALDPQEPQEVKGVSPWLIGGITVGILGVLVVLGKRK